MDVFRSLLFVPAQRESMVEKCLRHGADVVALDLEEAVPAAEKAAAREVLRRWIPQLAGGTALVYARVNDVHSGLTRDDLLAVVGPALAGVILPKAESAQDVRDLDVLLREAEMAASVRPGTVRLLTMVESARGVLRCEDIAQASDRTLGLAIGGYDYTADLGVPRDASGVALAHIRYVVVQVAAAYGLVAVDTPYADIADEAGLVAETELVKAMGIKAKFAVHPSQVAVINRILTPDDDEVAYARRVIDAFDAALARGLGAISLDGRMIDRPIVERARRVVALAGAIAARTPGAASG